MPTCDAWIEGDYRSPKGASRNEQCANKAVAHVYREPHTDGYYCGVHLRRFKKFNEDHKRTGKLLGEDRDDWYEILAV